MSSMQLIDALVLDDFERGLLAVTRHLVMSTNEAATQAWQHAFALAVERWGEDRGLAIAYNLHKVIRAVIDCRDDGLNVSDPLCLEGRELLTEDEENLLGMLHHMRRDNTANARDAVDRLTNGRMDPYVIRAGLSLANRFPSGHERQRHSGTRPMLKVV